MTRDKFTQVMYDHLMYKEEDEELIMVLEENKVLGKIYDGIKEAKEMGFTFDFEKEG